MNYNSVRENRRERLKRMLVPQSAVFIGGASIVPAIDYCRTRGFRGNIYIVNPRRNELAGIPCVPNVGDLPEIPDVTFLAVPRENVVGVVRELSGIGVAGAICNTSGFSEMHGGEQSQRDLVKAAGEMPIIGPNCPGVANFADRSVFMMDHFGVHDENGSVALISNGGSYLSDLGCSDRSLPLAYSIGLGNQAMVTVADIMDVVLDDERIRAVNLYLEGIRDPAVLSAAALKAARKDIPVVVIKGGRTSAGRRATESHTASRAGDDIVTSALFKRLGFVEVRTPTEALETLKMLVYAPRVKGRRTAFATSSGSYAVLGGDIAEFNGLDLQPPSAEAAAELEKYLPPFVHPANPLDISSGQNAGFDGNLNIYRAYLSDDRDVALSVMCFPPEGGWDPQIWNVTTQAFAQAARERRMPAAFVNTLPEALPKSIRERMIADGLVPLQGMEDGIRAVSNAVRSSELADVLSQRTDEEILVPTYRTGLTEEIAFDEASAKAELGASGIAVPRSIVVTPDQTGRLDELDFPVAVKALSAGLAHKSELGAVVLRLGTPEEAWQAVRTMAEKLKHVAPEISISSFLVEEMVKDGVGELLVGIHRVDPMGLTLTIGTSGTEGELLRDTATILLPSSRAMIAEALRSLKLFQLLDGWRGRTKGDVEAAVDVIQKFAQFAISKGERFVEAEINPLIVRPMGQGAVAVDAVMRLARHQLAQRISILTHKISEMGLPTSITSRLRIPLISAPMQHVSGPELVSAVCRKGAIGAFPTLNARSPEELDQWLSRIEKACAESDDISAPFCPNIVMRRSSEALQADVDVLVKHRVKIVLASVGSPEAIIPQLHDVGCTVLTDVATMRHAEKAIRVGADGLVLLSAGAGGQTGWLNGLSFVRAVRSIYDGPVGLAGGLSDGHALWAARVLGCDFGMMGTRFIATHESLAPQGHKQMVVNAGIDDILLTKAINGFDANYLRQSILDVGLDLAELQIPLSVDEARKRFSADLAGTGPKRWTDIWSAGHTVSAVSEIQSAGEVVDEIADEYHTAMGETGALVSAAEPAAQSAIGARDQRKRPRKKRGGG